MEILGVIFFILGILLYTYSYFKLKEKYEVDEDIQKKNKELSETYNTLLEKQKNLINELNQLEQQEQKEKDKIKELNNITKDINQGAAAAFEQYIDALEDSYKQKEEEFESNIELLDNSYMNVQDDYLKKLEKVQKDLDKIAATRAAAIEAQRQEKIIKENKDKFRLNISDSQRNDVLVLERVKKELTNPRILSMLIWQTYFRDYMTELCNYILGSKTVCGIYKITNQITEECYIGQSVDIAKRWKDHAKCGLDIDRPQGNKLYHSMREDGIWNFTFELLESCKQSELNEKEKYFIGLYQSDKYGYNQTGGSK